MIVMELRGKSLHLNYGDKLIEKGQSCDTVYELQSGVLKCVRYADDGSFSIVEWFNKSQLLGLEALFGPDTRYSCDVTASSENVEVVAYRDHVFRKLLTNDAVKLASALVQMSMRIQKVENVTWSAIHEDLYMRFVNFFRLRVQSRSGCKELRIRMKDLANFLNTHPRKLSLLLHDLEEKKMLRLSRKKIEIFRFEDLIR